MNAVFCRYVYLVHQRVEHLIVTYSVYQKSTETDGELLNLTSVWMVQDHQFSVGFSDLILVGCGTKIQKNSECGEWIIIEIISVNSSVYQTLCCSSKCKDRQQHDRLTCSTNQVPSPTCDPRCTVSYNWVLGGGVTGEGKSVHIPDT